jgi:predicted DNA-binding transcriptional regulator AlpA
MPGARSNRPQKRKTPARAKQAPREIELALPSVVIDNGAPADIKLIFKPELLALLHVSYSSIFGWMRAGKFPLPRVIGPGSGRTSRIAWVASEVQAWLASRAQRVPKPPPAE